MQNPDAKAFPVCRDNARAVGSRAISAACQPALMLTDEAWDGIGRMDLCSARARLLACSRVRQPGARHQEALTLVTPASTAPGMRSPRDSSQGNPAAGNPAAGENAAAAAEPICLRFQGFVSWSAATLFA
jgi:hypothetical protein